jgi:hypothetical protein
MCAALLLLLLQTACREMADCKAFVWDSTCGYLKNAERPMVQYPNFSVYLEQGTASGHQQQRLLQQLVPPAVHHQQCRDGRHPQTLRFCDLHGH